MTEPELEKLLASAVERKDQPTIDLATTALQKAKVGKLNTLLESAKQRNKPEDVAFIEGEIKKLGSAPPPSASAAIATMDSNQSVPTTGQGAGVVDWAKKMWTGESDPNIPELPGTEGIPIQHADPRNPQDTVDLLKQGRQPSPWAMGYEGRFPKPPGPGLTSLVTAPNDKYGNPVVRTTEAFTAPDGTQYPPGQLFYPNKPGASKRDLLELADESPEIAMSMVIDPKQAVWKAALALGLFSGMKNFLDTTSVDEQIGSDRTLTDRGLTAGSHALITAGSEGASRVIFDRIMPMVTQSIKDWWGAKTSRPFVKTWVGPDGKLTKEALHVFKEEGIPEDQILQGVVNKLSDLQAQYPKGLGLKPDAPIDRAMLYEAERQFIAPKVPASTAALAGKSAPGAIQENAAFGQMLNKPDEVGGEIIRDHLTTGSNEMKSAIKGLLPERSLTKTSKEINPSGLSNQYSQPMKQVRRVLKRQKADELRHANNLFTTAREAHGVNQIVENTDGIADTLVGLENRFGHLRSEGGLMNQVRHTLEQYGIGIPEVYETFDIIDLGNPFGVDGASFRPDANAIKEATANVKYDFTVGNAEKLNQALNELAGTSAGKDNPIVISELKEAVLDAVSKIPDGADNKAMSDFVKARAGWVQYKQNWFAEDTIKKLLAARNDKFLPVIDTSDLFDNIRSAPVGDKKRIVEALGRAGKVGQEARGRMQAVMLLDALEQALTPDEKALTPLFNITKFDAALKQWGEGGPEVILSPTQVRNLAALRRLGKNIYSPDIKTIQTTNDAVDRVFSQMISSVWLTLRSPTLSGVVITGKVAQGAKHGYTTRKFAERAVKGAAAMDLQDFVSGYPNAAKFLRGTAVQGTRETAKAVIDEDINKQQRGNANGQ